MRSGGDGNQSHGGIQHNISRTARSILPSSALSCSAHRLSCLESYFGASATAGAKEGEGPEDGKENEADTDDD